MVEAAHSPRIGVILRAMSALVPGAFFSEVPAAVEVQKKGTATILRAVRRGEPDKAADAYMRVMRQIGDKVVELFGQRGLFAPAAR